MIIDKRSFTDKRSRRARKAVRAVPAALAVTAVVLITACGSTTATATPAAAPTAITASSDGAVSTVELIAALEAGGFGTLASAIEQLGDVPLLPNGDFTMLAPTDDAFLALTSDETADVLSDPDLLLRTLRNHIIEGRVTERDLGAMSSVTTAGGTTLTVTVDDGVVMVGGAAVAPGELTVGSGVVHTIDAVLVP